MTFPLDADVLRYIDDLADAAPTLTDSDRRILRAVASALQDEHAGTRPPTPF